MIFKIFNHRYGMDSNQPAQNAGRSTASKRHLAVPVESRWAEETCRGSSKARPIGRVRELEAEASHQYTWKYFNILSICALCLYILAWYLASCTQLSREALLQGQGLTAGLFPGRHHRAVCAPRKPPPWVQ